MSTVCIISPLWNFLTFPLWSSSWHIFAAAVCVLENDAQLCTRGTGFLVQLLRLVECIAQSLHAIFLSGWFLRWFLKRGTFSRSLGWWICPFHVVGQSVFAFYRPSSFCYFSSPACQLPWAPRPPVSTTEAMKLPCSLSLYTATLSLAHIEFFDLFSIWPSAFGVSLRFLQEYVFHVLFLRNSQLSVWEFSVLFLSMQHVKMFFSNFYLDLVKERGEEAT